jgi:hypothetical protein
MFNSSVVVHYLNLVSHVVVPDKTNAPLVIDEDAVLSFSIILQGLQVVTGRNSQTDQFRESMQLQELSPCHPFDVSEAGHGLTFEQSFGVAADERMDHVQILFRHTESVKQIYFASNLGDQVLHGLHGCRPHQPAHFMPVAQQHQRGPELDPVTAAQCTARAVFDFEVLTQLVRSQSLRDQGLGGATVSTPFGTKLQQHKAGQRLHLGQTRRFDGAQVGFESVHGFIRGAWTS